MSTNNHLVRHPAPFPKESLQGYVLRLSEANGYPTPWALYRLAGMTQRDVRRFALSPEKLAAISNQPVHALENIGFAFEDGSARFCNFLGHALPVSEVSFEHPGFCPLCVHDQGFISAHWHLKLMLGCPLHRCTLVTTCGSCLKPIKWFRPGLLTCHCGGSLLDQSNSSPISSAGASLLAVIQARVHEQGLNHRLPHGLPCNDLLGLDLRSLLRIVRVLGRHRLQLDKEEGRHDHRNLVEAAATVLENWPQQLFELLHTSAKKSTDDNGRSFCIQFRTIYTSLFKGRDVQERQAALFLKKAFLTFATEHWDGYVDPKLLKCVGDTIPKRVTVTQLATKLKVQPRTVMNYLTQTDLPINHSRRDGSKSRILLTLSAIEMPVSCDGKILRVREAAARLEMSPGLLKALKLAGVYKVHSRLLSLPGYHEHDIQQFRDRIKAVMPLQQASEVQSDSVALRVALRNPHHSTAAKVSLVRELVDGDMIPCGKADASLGSLLIERSSYEGFMALQRQNEIGMTRSVREAASILACDPDCVAELVDKGILIARDIPSGRRILSDSVDAFRSEWATLVCVARKIGTSTRGLMNCCNAQAIPMMMVPARRGVGPQPFILIADIDRLVTGFQRTQMSVARSVSHMEVAA